MIDVIVVNLDRPKETTQTINALLKANDDIKVILINNGSVERPAIETADRITVIDIKENLGQAGGVNVGLNLSKTEYVVFMHNDIIINDKNWIAKAVDFLKENKQVGLVGIYGWGMINGKVNPITSLKGHRRQLIVPPADEFTQVFRTDEMSNIFKNDGLRADERYKKTCCGVWIDVLARRQKLYVIKLEDGIHLHTHEHNPGSQAANRRNIRLLKLKEKGLRCII